MSEGKEFSKIPLGAIRALSGQDGADFAVYLDHEKSGMPVLYRAAGADLNTPDFERLSEYGLSCFHVQTDDLRKCENILECRLREVLERGEGTATERTQLLVHVGTSVARDLSAGPEPGQGLSRATRLFESVMCGVLSDPHVAAHMLHMTSHEVGIASHMFIVSMLAIAFGQEVTVANERALKELGLAGMMHDIGKLGLAAELLNKDGRLSPEEYELIQQHPIESVRLLRNDPAVTDNVRLLILEHHERVDGQGYPLGLHGEDLSVGGRVLAIVDTFHALIGRRSYRASVSTPEAIQMIQRQAGRQFDADLVRCWSEFIERIGRVQPIESFVNTADAGKSISPRHEHRTAAPRRSAYGNRAKRFVCHTKKNVDYVFVGRLRGGDGVPPKLTAGLRDASRSGMCIFSEHPMYRGEMLNVKVEGGATTAWVRGVVAWCRRHIDGGFRAGIQFLHRVSPEEILRKVPIRTMAEVEEALFGECKYASAATPVAEPVPVSVDRPEERSGAQAVLEHAKRARTVPRALEAKIIEVSSTGDRDARVEALGVLGNINTRAARAALVAMLDDPDPEVCARVIDTVGLLGLHEASGKLQRLLKSDDEGCAIRATSALAQLGDKSALPFVVAVVERDGPNARLAARILGTIIGQRFAANAEGVRAARRYIEASSLKEAV